jgi:hypothetical protein
MLIAYCRQCLAETQEKVVIAYGERRVDIDYPHDIHQDPSIRNGLFPIPSRDWKNVVVDGDDTQTKANIVAQFDSKFV